MKSDSQRNKRTKAIRIAKTVVAISALTANFAYADLSSTITLTSDYLFNGVSQTDENPALQASLDWSNQSGFYAGTWGSNVDFGDQTNAEVDVYAGFSNSISENVWYDAGYAYYSYWGGSESDEGNYGEFYFSLGYNNTSAKVWFANDYFGLGADHYIVALMHSFELSDKLSLNLKVDRSESLDSDIYSWEDDDSYMHWSITASYLIEGVTLSLGLEDTDLDTFGDRTLLASVSYNIGW